MSATVHLFITANGATPAIRKLGERLGGRVLHQAIGAAMLSAIQTHFDRRAQEPNKMGAPKTGFWEKLSSGSFATSTETEAVVTIPAPILQKLYGGTIRPVNAKALAFPVSPNSYGKTAREMRASGLTKFIPLNRGNLVGIIIGLQTRTETYGNGAKSYTVNRIQHRAIGEVLFLVVRKVTQAADPNAIPSGEALMKTVMDAIEESADALLN